MRNLRPKQKKSEYREELVEVNRVSRVIAGGKRFSFRAALAVGDERGRVGFGVAKGLDVATAINKARRKAEKNVIRVNLVDNRTIPFMIEEKYGAARVRVKPAKQDHGLIAGGVARTILELSGVRDASAKIVGTTKNKIANARATLKVLENFIDKNKNNKEEERVQEEKEKST